MINPQKPEVISLSPWIPGSKQTIGRSDPGQVAQVLGTARRGDQPLEALQLAPLLLRADQEAHLSAAKLLLFDQGVVLPGPALVVFHQVNVGRVLLPHVVVQTRVELERASFR